MSRKLDYNYCHAAPILEWMSHKWAVVTLLHLKEAHTNNNATGVRFSSLFRAIPHISEKMLASVLDYLEKEGLVKRIVYKDIPLHVEYALTPLAESFLREISYVVEWGQQHYEEIIRSRNEIEEQKV